MKIGILQTGHAPDELIGKHGDYDQMFARLLAGLGFEFETFPVLHNEFPESVTAKDGWIVTGSKHGAYEDHDWIPPLENFIRESFAKNVPMAGFCFGHQIMAQALGGKVVKFDGGWAAGRTDYRMGDETLTMIGWHQDQVVEIPPMATPTMETDFCRYAGLSYGSNAMSWQPHPEFTTEFAKGLLAARYSVFDDAQAKQVADSLTDEPLSTPKLVEMVRDFFMAAKQGATSQGTKEVS
ncbi:glutamine amidotransferase [Amylibacter kogurei]|uniref:Glutamine amidotransferase n=1 Tax=Paramylibacter kogurei TaxID=1889778 RepID=A0A2G5K3H8_9RHOB|nr:type 1 glutamine amidotransferase [Amylibacter kogurei]PIB24096.1 glutamine amidotransferase [Amylibacter kogurei]